MANVPILHPQKNAKSTWCSGGLRGYNVGALAKNRLIHLLMFPWYRNQSTDFQCKSFHLGLYEGSNRVKVECGKSKSK